MGKISIKKVISDVRDAYVDLTGDTDEITYGNISTKISEIETGGGEGDGSLKSPFYSVVEITMILQNNEVIVS